MKELLLWPIEAQSHRKPLSDGEECTSELLSSCQLQLPSSEGSTGTEESASRMAPSRGCSGDLSSLITVSRMTQIFDNMDSP